MDLSQLASELSPETFAALQAFLQDSSLQTEMKKKIEDFHEEIMKEEEENKMYSTMEYWENRYSKNHEGSSQPSDGFYDWLCDSELLLPTWRQLIRPDQKVLVVGCGNSQLTEQLFSEGYPNLTCMDFSPKVIENMRARWHDFLQAKRTPAAEAELAREANPPEGDAIRPGVSWDVEDLRAMHYPSASFDVVFDKATLDALLTNKDREAAGVPRALAEIARVIAPGGRYIWISWGENKLPLLQEGAWGAQWEAERVATLSKGPGALDFDVYVCTKK